MTVHKYDICKITKIKYKKKVKLGESGYIKIKYSISSQEHAHKMKIIDWSDFVSIKESDPYLRISYFRI